MAFGMFLLSIYYGKKGAIMKNNASFMQFKKQRTRSVEVIFIYTNKELITIIAKILQ